MKDTFQEVLLTCEIAKGNSILGEINSEYPPRQVYCTEATLRTIVMAVDLLLLEHTAKYDLLQLLLAHQ